MIKSKESTVSKSSKLSHLVLVSPAILRMLQVSSIRFYLRLIQTAGEFFVQDNTGCLPILLVSSLMLAISYELCDLVVSSGH